MKKNSGVVPVGNFVFIENSGVAMHGYGVVVDVDFWKKRVQEDDLGMLESFDKYAKEGVFQPTSIMLLSERIDCRNVPKDQGNFWSREKYVQKFVWVAATYLVRFNDAEEFFEAMEQVKCFAGGLSTKYIESVIFNAGEIRKYLEKPSYSSELCELYEQAFPGMKAVEHSL